MRLVCDMDGVFVNLLGTWLKSINRAYTRQTGYHAGLTEDDIKTWNLEESDSLKQLGIGKTEVYKRLTPAIFKNAKPYHNAHHILFFLDRDFTKNGWELFVLTRPTSSESLFEKNNWVKKWIGPEFDKRMVYAHKKHAFRGDIFIDDHPETCIEYLEHNPNSLILVPQHNYNSTESYRKKFDQINRRFGHHSHTGDAMHGQQYSTGFKGIRLIERPDSAMMWKTILSYILWKSLEMDRTKTAPEFTSTRTVITNLVLQEAAKK